MAYVLDGVVILIMVLAIAFGYRRGFIRSIVQLVGLVAAFLLAFSFSETVSPYVYDSFINESLHETVSQALQAEGSSTAADRLDAAVEKLPAVVGDMISGNPQAQNMIESLGEKADATAAQLADTLVTDIIRPIVVAVLRFVAFLVLFFVLLLLVKLLSGLVKPITKLPLIRQADGLLGACVGVLKGALFVVIAVTVMQLLASTDTLITNQQIGDSLIVSRLAELNPVGTDLFL